MTARLRAFVEAHSDCFKRSLQAGHVTGSAWIVDRALGATLLVHHAKLDKWLQPGGHADGEPDVRAVALREAREETGLVDLVSAGDGIFDVDVHAIPARGDEPAHEHYDVRFAFFADRHTVPRASEESHAVAWIALDDLERYAIDDSVRRMAAKTVRLGALR